MSTDTPPAIAAALASVEYAPGHGLSDRLYARFGWKVWPITAAVTCTVLILLLAAVWFQISRILQLANRTLIEITVLYAVVFPIGLVLLVADTVRACAPLRRVSAEQSDLVTQFQATVLLPQRITRSCVLMALALAIPGSLVMQKILRANVHVYVFVWLCAILTLTTVIAGLMFATPLLVRPFVADLLTRLEEPPPAQTMTLRARLAFLIPVFGVATTATGAVIAVPKGSGVHAATVVTMVVAIAVGLLVWTPLVSLFARSMRAQLSDLVAATNRIEKGDYTQPVPAYWVDELGSLAVSLNKAMRGLGERRQMANEVRESRARIVAAADASRKKIERNIHDGAQQRLVALTIDARLLETLAQTMTADQLAQAHRQLAEGLKDALAELRDLARGLHPAVLTTDGLGPALHQLAARGRVPISIDAPATRFAEQVETTAYFVTAEALANIGKYAHATKASVTVHELDGQLRIEVVDDGIGGATPHAGSGLSGLADRVAAIGGKLSVHSPIGSGTHIVAELPL